MGRGWVWGFGWLLAACLWTHAPSAQAQRGPVIERIEPTTGAPGVQISIIGRGLSPRNSIWLGNVELPVVRRLPNRWTVQLPAGAQSGPLIIRTRLGDFQGPYFRVIAGRPAPVVTSIVPASAPPGAEVTLVGQNFSPRLSDNIVFLGPRPAVVRSATPTQLRVIVPQGAPSGSFVVRVAGAGEVQSPPFQVGVALAITAVEPAGGQPRARITLRGVGLVGTRRNVRVTYGGLPAGVHRITPTELVVQVPRRATGVHPFVVTLPDGSSTSSPPFVVQRAPVVDDVTPRTGPPGTLLVIRGRHFGNDVRAVQVRIGGRPLRVRAVTDREIRAEVLQGTPAGNVEVQVHALTVASRRPFETAATLALSTVTPTSGAPGSIVTLRGSGFDPRPNQNVVTIGGARAEVATAAPTQLQVRVPDGPSGTIEVQVGTMRAHANQPFVVTSPPAILDFQPRTGPAGTLVTIRGRGFGNRPGLVRAEIAGLPMRVHSASEGQVVVEVPGRARSGRIAITVGMRGGAGTPGDFQVETTRRQVSAITPPSGFAGTEITIRGQGFPRRGILVQFAGATPVPAQRDNPVQIRAIVPQGAQSGPVTVLLPGGRSMPAGDFTVTAAPTGTAITSVAPQCAYPRCNAVLRGHGFSPIARRNRVTFGGQRVNVVSATATAITIRLPEQPRVNARFQVQVRGGGQAQSAPFMILARPRR